MKVSIVIPLRNEERYISQCLASLLNQDFPKENMEILLVDGMSEDLTKEIIEKYTEKYPFIHLFDNPNKFVPTAMNIGITNAKGDLIVRMDAHAQYAGDYVSKCVEWSNKTGAENVGGPMRAVGKGYIGKAVEFAHHSRFGLGGGKFHDENYSGEADTVYLGAFRREVFDQIGMYDPRLVRNQDIELNSRIRAAGGRCYLATEINSTYFCRSTLIELWKQNFKNGQWNIYTNNITKNALSIRHFVPLIFVVSIFVSALMPLSGQFITNSVISKLLFLPLIICGGSYLIAALLFSVKIALEKGLRYLPIMPVVFLTLHFSYGMGSIKGVFTVNKWLKTNKSKD